MKTIFTFFLVFTTVHLFAQVAEVEPNNTFEFADFIGKGTVKTGSVNNLTSSGVVIDQYDYFMAILPTDGTLKIFVNATNTHNVNGYLYFRGYDRRKAGGQVFEKYIANNGNIAPNAGVSDVITLNGRAADTFYFRMETSGVFSYSLSYNVTDLSDNDIEPNGTFEQAIPINQMEEKRGHISYAQNGTSDQLDYYKTNLQKDGTLKIFVAATNNSAANNYLYFRGYDRRKGSGQVFENYISNNGNILPGATVYDTLYVFGRASDSFFFRVEASGAFSYQLKYDVLDTSENDAEPNDVFETAIAMNSTEEKKGHISYIKNGTTDQHDYYRTVLPVDGTLKIYVEGTNSSGGNGYLYFRGYDKRKGNGQVFETYISGNGNVPHGATITDSVIVYGVLADTFYFRMEANGAFKYKVRYTVVQNSDLDAETNNTFDQAIHFNQGVTKIGQVGYTSGGIRDDYDYYKTSLPKDGTLKIFVKGTNNSGSNGYLYFRGYDNRKGNGQVFEKYIANNGNITPGATVFDTITVHGRSVDSFYFRMESVGAFSYNLSYTIVDTSENDAEPNNTFEEAIFLDQKEIKKGHIGYVKIGAPDQYDYYKTFLQKDGTLKIFVKATNNGGSNGYVYFRGYDRRKGSGQVFEKYIVNNGNITPGTTVYDTITVHARAIDSFYFRVEQNGPFSYNLSYDVIDTSENDAEPNGTFEEALVIGQLEEKNGHIGYIKNGTSDQYDYYRAILPKDGTLRIYVKCTNTSGGNGYSYFRGFDRRKGNGQIFERYLSNDGNIPHGKTIFDTINVFSRAADTFYFRLDGPAAFTYNLKYEVLDTSENDVEPNGTFAEALGINPLEEKKGHIGYVQGGTDDQLDHYRAILPKDGTLKIFVSATNRSGANGYVYFRGYDRRRGNGQVFEKYLTNDGNIPNGKTIFDTIPVSCRAADTFYFRIESVGAFTYTLKYDMTDTSVNDAEPNNSFETGTNIALGVTGRGHIGYVNNGVSDSDDYFKTNLPAKGTMKLIVQVKNTSGGNGYVYLYLYDKRKNNGNFLQRYIANNGNIVPGSTVNDTIIVNCLDTDSLYLRWTSNGCFSYSFKVEHTSRQPKANMTYERLGSQVGFRPQFANATSFLWSFGDNTSSTLQYPMKTYNPGSWTARLIVTNSVCNYKDTATQAFEIKGVEYYTPKKSGAGGDAIMQIFGGGLDTTTKVKLVKGGLVIVPAEKYTNTLKNNLTAVFDLHFAQSGSYDVVIEIPGEAPITYTNGFTIDNFVYPYTTAEVQGPSRWRINQDTRFSLVVNNKGNVIANHVVVAFVWPKDVSVKFEPKFIVPPATGIDSVFVDGAWFTLPRADYKFIYDSLQTAVEIDTFASVPYRGYMRYLLIPAVPANSTIELPFIAKTAVAGSIRFKAFTYRPNQRGSCPPGNWTDNNEDLTAELIDGADMIVDKTNIPLLKAFTKTAKIGQKHAGSASSYIGKHFWAWYDGYEVDENAAMADWLQETEANNAFALQTATDELGNLMLDKGVAKLNGTYQKQVDFINKRLASNPNLSAELTGKYIDKLNALTGANQRLNGLKDLYKNTKDLGALSEKILKIQKSLDDCPELQKQLEDLLKEADKELNQRDVKDKPTDPVTSMDPNEITGPTGHGVNRYLNKLDKHFFQVSFENLESAGAAAQIVKVRDTLDKNKYDLSSFEFGGISIGKKHFRLPKGRTQFVINRSLAPTLAMNVRINGSIDTSTGIIEWQMTAINPGTNDIPVFDGFLPPNTSKPDGEGTVSFGVNPKSTLPDGTIFTNRASIIFDQNEPILTNTWQNILDITPPTSGLTATQQDSVIRVRFTGNDAVSGVGYYNLHVRVNLGPWRNFSGTSDDTTLLIGRYDSSYSFYVTADDKVGNAENKAAVAEATIVLTNPLAITLGNITATNAGKRNRIDWFTLQEDAGDYFVIERSTDSRNFIAMQTVSARGTAGSYTIYDDNPSKGKTFYRLKTYNQSRDYKLSKVVSAYFAMPGEFMLDAFPNPVNDRLTIDIYGKVEGKAILQVITPAGTVLKTVNVVNNQTVLDLILLPRGVYLVRYNDDQRSQIMKVIKN